MHAFSSYDPKVPDGTSLAGPFGLDSTRYPNLTMKADQPGNYEEFMNKVGLTIMFNDAFLLNTPARVI